MRPRARFISSAPPSDDPHLHCPGMIGWRRARFYYGSPARAASQSESGGSSPNSSAGATPASTPEGELGEDRGFYFRGPDGALSLRVQNLSLFLQIAAGVDDRTWLYHLRAGGLLGLDPRRDRGRDLAGEVVTIERAPELSAGSRAGSRKRSIAAIPGRRPRHPTDGVARMRPACVPSTTRANSAHLAGWVISGRTSRDDFCVRAIHRFQEYRRRDHGAALRLPGQRTGI